MAFSRIVVEHPESSAVLNDLLNKPQASRSRNMVRKLSDYLRAIAGRVRPATVTLNRGAVKASGTLTFTGNPSNGETFAVAGVTFTAITSGASGDQWNIGAGATANATAVAAAVNASSNASGKVVASSAAGVVTFTAVVPGVIGNALALSESLSNAAVSGAALASGTDGSEVVSDLD